MKRKKNPKKSPRKSDNTHQSHISRFFFKAGSSSTNTDNDILDNDTKTKNQKAAKSQVGQSFEREKDNESEFQNTPVFVESENESEVQNTTVEIENDSEVQDPTVSVESEFF